MVEKGEKVAITNDDGSGTSRIRAPEEGLVVSDGHEAVFVSAKQVSQAVIDLLERKQKKETPITRDYEDPEPDPYLEVALDGYYTCECGHRYSRDRYRGFEKLVAGEEVDSGSQVVPIDWPKSWFMGRCRHCNHVIRVLR